jgi:hypothetical protein
MSSGPLLRRLLSSVSFILLGSISNSISWTKLGVNSSKLTKYISLRAKIDNVTDSGRISERGGIKSAEE